MPVPRTAIRFLKGAAFASGVVLIMALTMWAYGALHFDGPSRSLAVVQVLAIVAVFVFVKSWWRKLAIFGVWFAIVLGWWFSLKPTNEADWQPDVAQLPYAEIDGDVVTLHHVRNCDYRSETDFTPRWETRTFRLSRLTGIDIFITYWGSPYMAHPILSFQFEDVPPVCFSIETRKKVGQGYSAIGGLYRQYELLYIAADERDVIRLRSNYRKNENIYLYRTTASVAETRERFLEYLHFLNGLRGKPEWYNAIDNNCTTAIRHQHPASERRRWDWRILVNGKGDELMHERRTIVTGGLPFAELKRRVLINEAARAANDSPDFSRLIRLGRPGIPDDADPPAKAEFR